jgi:hypothetical protein
MRKLLLVLIASVLITFPGIGQSKLSKKEIANRLTANSWKVTKTWDGNYDDESGKQLNWVEIPVAESRQAEYFRASTISFKSDGTFSATRFNGENFSGKWSTKRGLKFTYKDEYELDMENEFETIQFTTTGFFASGDICHDGCYAKVEFEKVK